VGWLSDFFLGSEGDIDWAELQKMVELQAEINKTDRVGTFSGWEWERDPDGNPTGRQVQTINPAFQGAVDRLGGRAVQGHTNYQSPSQFSDLLNAKMSNQMTQHGVPPGSEGTSPWQPAQERPGLDQEAYLPPAPPTDGSEAPGFDKPYAPLPGIGYAPGDSPEEQAGYGLPPDYWNDKGNIRRKYRPDNKNYIGDEFLNRYKENPDYEFRADDPNNPAEWYDKNGNLKDRYRVGG